METSNINLLQLIAPAVVLLLLVVACMYFYKNYVVKSRALYEVLMKTSSTVRSMSEGEEMMRKTGVGRVFQNTLLEQVWRDFAKTLHTQNGMMNGVKKEKKFRLTVPVPLYFSVSAVVDRPLGVDYFKHLPGILTGIGIIGTFSGLLFGLSSFDASSAERMTQSISLLLGGVRDAFYASAAAITAAMVITHWEKMLYRRCLSALDELVDALNSLFEAGVGEEYLATLVHQSNSSSDIAQSLKDELLQAMVPVLKQMETIQSQQAACIGEALENALTESNKRLASHLETALIRQVKKPIEEMSSKLDNRLSHLRSNPQDIAMKVIRARQQDGYNEVSSSEAV